MVFEGLGGEAKVMLNDHELSGMNSRRFSITELLQPTNDLQVEIAFAPSQTPEPGGLWGFVVLEISE